MKILHLKKKFHYFNTRIYNIYVDQTSILLK